MNDVPEIREVFGRFDLTEVETSYTIGSKAASRGKRGELVVVGGLKSVDG